MDRKTKPPDLFSQRGRPSIHISPTNVEIVGGQSHTITCSVSSISVITDVTWIKTTAVGYEIVNVVGVDGKFSGGALSDPSLTINNIVKSDEGTYVCRATNCFGTTSSEYSVLTCKGALSNRRKSIFTDPKGMHAVLGRITVTVLPKMCQQILESIIFADNLYCSFQNRNDLKIILVEEELEIINTMVSNGYKHFTIQLCYKILRHEQWVGKPRQNWGNVPIHTDIHISDDIERIRLSRNKIVSMETKSLDKTTFLTLIDEFSEIAERVDFYLKKDVKFLLQIQPTESMTKAEIESTVEEIRRLPVIEDNPFPVHTINQGRTNYARLGLVVVDIFQNILREIMRSNIAPEVLHRHIIKLQQNNPSVFGKMTHEERKSLNTLSNRTYDNIDFTTSYKLMRSLLLLDDPTQGWGKQPTNVDVTISDDVERLRNTRNKIVHRIKADIDLIEMNNYFSNIVHITQRIDTYLCKLPYQGFAREVLNFQTHCMDSEMEQKYYKALKDIEDIKEKYSVENVHFCYGKTFSNFIKDVQNKTKTSVESISLVLEDINDDKKPSILNELKTEINSGLVNIKFKQAISGSLIIYIDILDSNLLSTVHELGHQIYNFLCRALQLTGFNMKTENEITVVLIKEEDDIEVEFSIEIDNWETYDEEISLRSNTLCLELDVNTEIFKTEQKIQSDFGLLVKNVLGSNGNSNIESVSARLELGIVAQQSAQVEPVSGTSGVGPTTFQQDQSAKKKLKKSNNENEGDVSTILQESDESAQQSAQGEPVSGTSGLGPSTSQQDQSAKRKPKKSNNDNEGDVSTILQESDQNDEAEAEALSKKENFFLLYFLCKKIATQAVQVFFDSKVPGHTLESFLKQHKSNLTSLRSVYRCTKDQEAKLFPGGQVVVVSTDFDFSLQYKLIRNLLTAIPAPTCGWGMQPLPGHLNETDDIERIRYLRNSLAHNSDFEICDTDFSTHWTDLSQVIDRLSKGSLSTAVESMRTKKFDKCIINEMEEEIRKEEKKTQEEFMSECSTDIADNKQKIYDIDDRHIPLNIQNEADFLSKGGNNFIRLMLLCQKIGTQAVRVFFYSKVPGHTLESFLKRYKSHLTSHGSVYRCTKDQEVKLFPGGQVAVASADFNFTLLYKLIRNSLTAIPPPTCGWGNQPLPGHLNEADDIERIRHLRNYLANNSDLEICDTDFSTHWTDLSQAIDRLSKGSLSTDVESMRTKKFDKCIINEMEEDIRKEEKKTQEEFMSECSTDIADNKQKIYDIDDRHIPLNIQKCIEVEIIQKGPISVGHGGTIRINAKIISNSTGSLKVNWQKTHGNCSTALRINRLKYSGSSCNVNNPELVINNFNKDDAGIYKLEVTSATETISSPGILLELFRDEADSLPKEGSNFFRLYVLCQKIATQAIRDIFDSNVHGLESFLEQHKSDLTSKSSAYRCTKEQKTILFPGNQVTVDSADFDFTLLYKLIRNLLTTIPAPISGWGNPPLPQHINEADDIERIRGLRNKLAHNSEFEICDIDFSTHWTDLSQAINRLSKGSLSTDVESMRTKKFDKCTINKMEEDIRKELKEIKQDVTECRTDIADNRQNIADNKQAIHNINTSHIPLNIKKGHVALINEWRKENELFYDKTQGFTATLNMVKAKRYMTIIGGPGSGKTATAHHIALQLEEQGWEVVPVCELKDIIDYGHRDQKQVFVLDDVLGIFAVKMDHIINYQENIVTAIGETSKLLFTCRKSVYREAFKFGFFVTENVVDLQSKDNQLTKTERMAIFQCHCKAKGVNPDLDTSLSFTNSIPMFPLLCKLFLMEKKYQQMGESFFNKPFKYFISELDKLLGSNTIQYAVLVLCLVNEGKLSVECLPQERMQDVFNNCGVNRGTSDKQIIDAICYMSETYFTKLETEYTFTHDFIFEVIAYHYGCQNQHHIFKYLSSSYIANKVIVYEQASIGDLCIQLSEDMYLPLAERLYKDIKSMNLFDVFMNKSLKHSQFLDVFEAMLKGKPIDEFESLILRKHENISHFVQKTLSVDKPIKKWSDITERRHLYLLFDTIDCGKSYPEHSVRVISWIIYYGHTHLLQEIVNHVKCYNHSITLIFGSNVMENTRLLTLGCFNNNLDMVELILEYVDSKCIDMECGASYSFDSNVHRRYTPLTVACESGDLRIVTALLRNIADVNKCYYMEEPPLLTAVNHGHVEVVNYLLNSGADIHLCDHLGKSLLFTASEEGHFDIVKELVAHNADVNWTDQFNRSPLHSAVKMGYIDIARFLLENGADVNIFDFQKKSLLKLALSSENYSMAHLLEKHGASSD